MIRHGCKEGYRQVAALPARVWCASPPNFGRNRSGTRNHLKRIYWFIAAIVLATAAAQAVDSSGAAAVAEGVSTRDEVVHSYPALRQGTRMRAPRRGGVDQRRLNAVESPDNCLESPLWEKKVDPGNYIFGCKEIEVSIFL